MVFGTSPAPLNGQTASHGQQSRSNHNIYRMKIGTVSIKNTDNWLERTEILYYI